MLDGQNVNSINSGTGEGQEEPRTVKIEKASKKSYSQQKRFRIVLLISLGIFCLGIIAAFPIALLLVHQHTQYQQRTAKHVVTRLTWSPPRCGDVRHSCVNIYLSDIGSGQAPTLINSNDYRIHLPRAPLRGGLQIRGGHNVIIIGGEIDLTVPCSDATSMCHGINISRSNAGQVFIEGVWIHNPQSPISQSTGDGIDVNAAPGPVNVTLENVRIDGISGCSGSSDHADIFQPYDAGNAKLYIDNLTGTTNCQGLQIDPDYAYKTFGTRPLEGIFKNVNINVIPNPYSGNNNRYTWWFVVGNNPCIGYPVELINDYVHEPTGTLSINSIWPDTDQPSSCKSVWNAGSGIISFPTGTQITGVIKNGFPPGGDFVPVGIAGIGYVSPGYLN